MSIQATFRQFHEKIALKRFNESATLREKRDRVLNRLRKNCSHSFVWFNQGSYEMGTGVRPIAGDYDIDVGVVFTVDKGQHLPTDVKAWVYDAVESHTSKVEWRRPCITVYYQQSGEAVYHVDLAIYVSDQWGNLHLAMGKKGSGAEHREWLQSDPKGLISTMGNRYSGEDSFQFRRVIQYLKRWKDVNFSSQGNAAPVGIGLTVAAHHYFRPTKRTEYVNYRSTTQYDDLGATLNLVQSIRGSFRSVWSGNEWAKRLEARLPVLPQNDVFERMTNQQMLEFKQRIEKLEEALLAARDQNDLASLKKLFGSDFDS